MCYAFWMKYILVSLVVLNGIVFWYLEESPYLTVSFLDVGQGDAIFIEAPNGNQVLIDGGPNTAVLRELSKVMPLWDRSIDVVIATHSDVDHIGGLPEVLEQYDVEVVVGPHTESDTATFDAFKDAIPKQIIPIHGTEIVLDEDITLTILFPDRDMSFAEPNASSIISHLVYGETEFLFMGDAPKAIERLLLHRNIESDVLHAGHHGSKTSTDAEFVGRVDPEFVVISAGKDNRYGHPHEEVLEVLEGREVLGTYDVGTIMFESDGTDIWRK